VTNGDTATLFANQPFVAGGGTLANVESFATVALTSFNDSLVFGNQDAKVTAYAWHGNDTLIAQQANVEFTAARATTCSSGGPADHFLSGEDGNDRLVGGQGFYSFSGGAGNDRFIFVNVDDDCDNINDFDVQQDMIDLSVIDANLQAAGDQAFTFTGNARFPVMVENCEPRTRTAAMFCTATSTVTRLADFVIDLGVSNSLTGSNFILY
jgi:Ca2+-binding RTX toxin-like protein